MADIAPLLKMIHDTYNGNVHVKTDPPHDGHAHFTLEAVPESPLDGIDATFPTHPWRCKVFSASRLPDTCLMAFYEHSDGSEAVVVFYYEKPSGPSPRTDWTRLAE